MLTGGTILLNTHASLHLSCGYSLQAKPYITSLVLSQGLFGIAASNFAGPATHMGVNLAWALHLRGDCLKFIVALTRRAQGNKDKVPCSMQAVPARSVLSRGVSSQVWHSKKEKGRASVAKGSPFHGIRNSFENAPTLAFPILA